ncbi:rho GTPase-activating protein 20 [Bombina bombina]|uniref:rho GTPase-activating protein 20 n=1 Tax=Bombina bombina TaxID=8345 RepID=UPI00235ABE69|nr:rho GTPase-activating protein 20 [Bombina bombina]
MNMKMTPQQKANLQITDNKDLGTRILEGSKKMRASVQRRRSTPSPITKSLSKTKLHSRETNLLPTNTENGLLIAAFCAPNSLFILKDRVQLTSGWQTQERIIFLFRDSLIIAKSKSSSSLKLKNQVRLSDLWISTSLQEASVKKLSAENSFVIGWPITNYTVTFSTSDTKDKWLSTLSWYINDMKKDDYSSKVTIDVVYTDAEEITANAAVSVSNMDTAEKVIKLASQQLGLSNRSDDFHLCVIPGKDEPPYPLIGHEYPYSIIMSYLRDSLELSTGSNNYLFWGHSSEMVINEQLLGDRQCQFILKVKPQIPLQFNRESAQKHSKRKKSLIDWALRRSGSTPPSSPASQSPTTHRRLFGVSLSSLCTNGNLPKPIMDMLLLIYKEGPNTEGIFRRSANAKICKEVKEKLMSGDDVRMDGESVFIAASVITDFLRNIPESILCSDMYGMWMEAMDIGQHKDKIEAMKRLVEQLPEANVLLLKHLFAVLHHIEQNSEENRMNAFNLAVCTAPNMLWLPIVTDPEEESRSAKKVAPLVQFLIENYEHIFGQDAASMFQKSAKEHSARNEDFSSTHLVHGRDSSDELEYASSDLEKSDPNLLKDMDGIFDESLLIQEMEDWDLFSEIAACYQSKTRMNNLECHKDPLSCTDSACSLIPARDRCSSEPSVCLSSRLHAQDHEPVARQSSCDATMMHNHLDYINQLKQLKLESQKLLDEVQSPNGNKTRRTLWRSHQPSISMKNLSPQTAVTSNRSSISSLSSTTTSPSASSLSSLDSAFSYCSESSVFSPSDVPMQPFMFGTSARLCTLSPEISKKKLNEWHAPLAALLNVNACDLDSCEEQEDLKEKQKMERECMHGVTSENTVESSFENKTYVGQKTDNFCYSAQFNEQCNSFLKSKWESSHVDAKADSKKVHCVRRETSVKHIEIRRPESSNDESIKRTKIAFFMSPNIMQTKELEDQNPSTETVATESKSVTFQIPQTVFYGQNTPLVLHSVSRRQHPEVEKPHWQTQLKHVLKMSPMKEPICDSRGTSHHSAEEAMVIEEENKEHNLEDIHPEGTAKEPALTKIHSKTIASFSNTMRIILPTSVRNTVKEYFKHNEHKSHSLPHTEVVENELIQSRIERCNLQGTDFGKEAKEKECVVEEFFV